MRAGSLEPPSPAFCMKKGSEPWTIKAATNIAMITGIAASLVLYPTIIRMQAKNSANTARLNVN